MNLLSPLILITSLALLPISQICVGDTPSPASESQIDSFVSAKLTELGIEASPVTVHVIRKDGFGGEVMAKIEDEAKALSIKGSVPADADSIRLTIAASKAARTGLIKPEAFGVANINGTQAKRSGVPADDRMQAFLWRFLVPAEEWCVNVRFPDKVSLLPQLRDDERLRIPAGDSAHLILNAEIKGKHVKGEMTLSLDDPPSGISMENVTATEKDRNITLSIAADEELVKVGQKGYLIVTGVADRGVVVGMTPAIPFEIVE